MSKWIKRGNAETIEELFLENVNEPSLDKINDWFRCHYAHSYRIDRLTDAVSLVKNFKDMRVTIVGDYDSDGVTSTSILYLALKWAGFSDVVYRIPKRFSEGFGINRSIVDEINDGLVITCDNGIAQIDAINYAKEKGLTVIILDHHLPETKDDTICLPDADIIIDPNAIKGSADFNGYCGAGLSYRFACELLDYRKDYCYKLLGLAAIGTVADVMELKKENYVIVRNGLKTLLNINTTTVGAYALISAYELNQHITATDIGFKIAPTINAVSRMNDDGAMDAVKLLTFNGAYTEAVYLATRLVEINKQRKDLQKEGLAKAMELIKEKGLEKDVPLIVYLPNIKEGIIGIIAANISEAYRVPAIVVTDAEESGMLKGSARSCGDYNIKESLDQVSEYLTVYGGHQGAAGLTLPLSNLDIFKKRLNDLSKNFNYVSSDAVYYDLEIKAKDVPACIEELKKYEPYGEGNPMPIFKVTDFQMIPKFGSIKKVVGTNIAKVFCHTCTAFGFDMAARMEDINDPITLSFIGKLADNYFNGNVTHQIEFSDFIKS